MLDHQRPAEAATVVLDNLESIMECVSAGLGFTMLPVPDVDRYRTSAIQTLPVPGVMQRKLVLAMAKDSVLSRRAAALQALFEVQ